MTARLRLKIALGPALASKGGIALAVVAIALGVALGFAVQLVNHVALNELGQAVRTFSGTADLELRGPSAGFDEELYARIARMPGVAVASPMLEIDVVLPARREPLRVLGVDVFRATRVQPQLFGAIGDNETDDRLDTLRPDVLYLSSSAAASLGAARGDPLRVQVGLNEKLLRIGGVLPDDSAQFGVMDIAGAQQLFDRLGRLTRIAVRLAPGTDVAAFAAQVQAELPPGLSLERPEASVQRAAQLSRSYRVNLNVLALVALFTGGLLMFSTQALAVVRRRSQFAALRVFGWTRGQVLQALLVEAAVVGVVGAALGLASGYVLAELVLEFAGADLGAGFFRGVAPRLSFEPRAAMLFFVLGLVVALLGTWVPALEAARAAPAAALKAGDEQRVFERLRPAWPGLATIALGAAAAFAPPVNGLPLFGYGAIALLLIGAIMLMPRAALLVFAALPESSAPPLKLALAQLRGAPGQAMVSLATIVASVSLVVSMAIMVASFRDSLAHWLQQILPADLYVRSAPGAATAFLTPDDQASIAALPGVMRVDFLRSQQLLIAPDRSPVTLIARPVPTDDPGRVLPLLSGFLVPAPGAAPVWISEPMAEIYGYALGQVIALPIAGANRSFTVAGIWRDYARQQGAVLIDRERYIALTGDRAANDAAIWLTPNAHAAEVRELLRRGVRGGDKLDIAAPDEIRVLSLKAFDRTFAVTYALELVSLVIGLFGLSASFGALVLARRREFGMLRHIGMTRAQIGGMLAAEGFAVSGLGIAVGLALGWMISLILIHVVNRQSFHFGMELAVPWYSLASFSLLMLATASLTALASARQAMSGDAVQAVKNDW